MKVSINCPKCGKGNPLPEARDWTEKELSKEGSTGSRSCIGCGAEIIWTGDQLVKTEDQVDDK